MKRFSQFNLKKLILLFVTVVVIILLYHSFPVYYDALHVQAQLQQLPQPSLQQQSPPIIGIKITSPTTGQQVPVGQLTISGTSTDNATTDCTVYADWNNLKPIQKAIATGPGGVNDYSTWNYTYTNNYHLITNGTNELTSKLSCISSPTNLTKFYSVNLIGIATMTNNKTSATSAEVQQQESPTIDNTTSTTNVTLDNGTTTVVKEQGITTKDNVSSPTSIPIPLVANNFAFDKVNVNITSPKFGQQVPVGNLTIAGHSSDNPANDCIVYTDWNGQNPLQIAKALGPGGVNDYSTWSFTYTPAYHAIINGTNELTAQISCLDDDSNNNNNNKTNNTAAYLTNYYRVNVTGITEASSSSERTTSSEEQKEQTDGVGSRIPIPIPSPLPSSPPSTQKQEEEDKDVEKEEPEPEPQPEAEPEPEPEPEPQPTTPLTEEDDKTVDTDEEEGNTVKQEKKVKEIQEEDKVQEQLQQMLEKAGKINEEVQQKVDKAKEDILEEIKKGFK
jgi:hypothetical protein